VTDNPAPNGGGSFFALHDQASIGSVLKVSNPMNGRVIYCKVIGRLPGGKDDNRSIVKLSGPAAGALGVLDRRFLADVEYAAD
jgi:hypothetical protein